MKAQQATVTPVHEEPRRSGPFPPAPPAHAPRRTLVEELCHDVMFEAPERKGETVEIDADAVAAHLAVIDGGREGTAE